jgi:tight adherence protein C
MPDTHLVLGLVAALVAVGLAASVGVLLAQAAEDRDVAHRIATVMHPERSRHFAPRALATGATNLLARIGDRLRRTALFAERDLVGLEQAIAAAGLDPRRTASVFITIKVMALLILPTLAYALTVIVNRGPLVSSLVLFVGVLLGVLGPNQALGFMRRSYLAALRRGLPDVLDLMVVCGEAGLGLESSVARIAKEMEASNPSVAREFATLSRELRILSNRREALTRMGERTGLDGYRRFGASLSQALRYGTPLSQALRVLASDMRQERTLKMEEKAARLPALLVLPLILFIMPSLLIVLIGPSVLQLMATLGAAR